MTDLERIPGGFRVKTDDGWHLHLLLRVRPRLVEVPVVDPQAIGRYWCYDTFEAAALAGMAWDISADTEPVGWVRNGGARPI